MIIIPAIDLKEGKCVRLYKGKLGTETVFSDDPVSVAKNWENAGAKWIHLVDLDGAFDGFPVNFDIIRDITENTSCKIQVGGGIRNIETVENYINIGVSRVIIGTAAFKDFDFLQETCKLFPDKIAVGIDTKNGKIAIKGWEEVVDDNISDVINKFHQIGVSLIIHTNVDKDGTMEGIDVDPIADFIISSDLPVVASGGIASISDLEKIFSIKDENLYGVILGKSIYTKSIDLEEAIKRFQ
ncbi:MAG: 1-(5-phosphoribosyl)-5-[(5-phosphoribosylamino)methylideneamino]imidazole-4-carboxamide isomerase [Candidatus Dadabacteria bacterium]|nr:1-(5-phosphoribosyl)-5-[(5-phosphoribosylamino)methylideneamino]imidazole-4-carboxamide isomerase [Candidatus Dadabacteria bacterium]NIQ14183.1 1-(5-phosphoribosyl)-5-[(5-phosphoribosylamino)methylideneamino]imidazole-4-carboxamide isomerase [Candidatus Dadabacteria bacterium]